MCCCVAQRETGKIHDDIQRTTAILVSFRLYRKVWSCVYTVCCKSVIGIMSLPTNLNTGKTIATKDHIRNFQR